MTREPPLLARYAESVFWMARYLERVENLARLIEVTQGAEMPSHAADSWYALIRINADETGFAGRGYRPDAAAVKQFYLRDRDTQSGVPAMIEAVRLNARNLRPIISTEMWRHINMLHRDLLAIPPEALAGDQLSRLCERIKLGIQEHTGITDGTMFRDQSWYFYQLGRLIERADQTTRLLDIEYHMLVPQDREQRRVTELTAWGGVLRAAAGYHAFRRVAPAGFTPADVVSFLLTDASFPRSVLLCVVQIERFLTTLRSRYGLRGTVPALERIEELRAALLGVPMLERIENGLHQFLDGMQRDLILLAADIGTAFFRDWRPGAAEAEAPVAAPAAGQSQSQG